MATRVDNNTLRYTQLQTKFDLSAYRLKCDSSEDQQNSGSWPARLPMCDSLTREATEKAEQAIEQAQTKAIEKTTAKAAAEATLKVEEEAKRQQEAFDVAMAAPVEYN
jgi:hypothetical protein